MRTVLSHYGVDTNTHVELILSPSSCFLCCNHQYNTLLVLILWSNNTDTQSIFTISDSIHSFNMGKIIVALAAMAFIDAWSCSAFHPTSYTRTHPSRGCYQSQTTSCSMIPMNQLISDFQLLASNDQVASSSDAFILPSGEQLLPSSSIEGLSPSTNIAIFIIGLIPFIWATYEFWTRIAVGGSFGTGADSIQIRPSGMTIGKDGDPLKSRGQQVLGDDALIVAYFLFAVAIGSIGIAVYSVISSPSLPAVWVHVRVLARQRTISRMNCSRQCLVLVFVYVLYRLRDMMSEVCNLSQDWIATTTNTNQCGNKIIQYILHYVSISNTHLIADTRRRDNYAWFPLDPATCRSA